MLSTIQQRLNKLSRPGENYKDNFKNMRTRLALEKIGYIDGALFDIGVSNYQISNPEKGFTFMADAYLDMRMDKDNPLNVKQLSMNILKTSLEIYFTNMAKRNALLILQNPLCIIDKMRELKEQAN